MVLFLNENTDCIDVFTLRKCMSCTLRRGVFFSVLPYIIFQEKVRINKGSPPPPHTHTKTQPRRHSISLPRTRARAFVRNPRSLRVLPASNRNPPWIIESRKSAD